jgi:RNA-directed DNA polymerase
MTRISLEKGVVEKVMETRKRTTCPDSNSESGNGAELYGEQQNSEVRKEACALTVNLMERICDRANLNRAYKRVKANKGAPGIDGLTVEKLGVYLGEHKEQLVQSLLDGDYKPQAVRKVMIPKSGGGERQLGIPTVVDRLIQQAIHQVLEPLFDKEFSESSFGFRPNRGAHDALKKAKEYVEDGHTWVVDMDLEKFFDRVNHDMLMSRLAKRIEDKRLLKIIRRFLAAGIMQDGVVIERHKGTPQGGPLSPLLSNIMLDELDKELERRGHKFCRYADDQNIYVRSKRAGERVYRSVKLFLETRLKLKVNDEKSAVAHVCDRKFLGYRILNNGMLTIAPKTIERAKDKIRQLAQRNRGRGLEQVISELNSYLGGWLNYFKLAEAKTLLGSLDSWIRRKLRCYKLKQKKRGSSMVKLLMSLGVSEKEARQIGSSGKGWWRLSLTQAVHRALNNAWFEELGLINLKDKWAELFNTS